ncbi:hypothetical protein A9W99_03275 [Mycobacterium sp. 1164966.3]|uniref:hypothetical protein n=1 Tax=Mycobacterium sp. 1164966.3 TaxID=1856861 RepID=UPI000800853F|nr:hypothetical protein [Mycobacterium sp. 1164966.3]OBA79177.1 hypothetical protein A9W99_03275 [Mycobacterium sp. 1164966.3]
MLVWFVMCAALVASVTSLALFIYWGRDKPARRTYRDAAFVALGAMWGLLALSRYLVDASPRWMMWFSALLAAATPISIWEARRKDARDDARDKEWD